MSLSDKVKLADLQSNVYDEECEEVFLLEDVKEKVKELKDFIKSRAETMNLNKNNPRMIGKASTVVALTELSNILYKIDEIFGEKLI